MPLARIFTLDPEQVNAFAQQLYDLGFEVDVVNPHEQPVTPADLEIEFAVCDQQQILARAAAIAAQLQAEIVVFPGAIPPLPRSMTAVQEAVESPVFQPENQHQELPTQIPSAHLEDATISSERLDLDHPTSAFDNRESPAPSVFSGLVKNLSAHRGRVVATLVGGLSVLKARFLSTSRVMAARTATLHQAVKSHIARAQAALAHRLAEVRQQWVETAQHASAIERQEQASLTAADREIQLILAEKQALLVEIERLRAAAKNQSIALEQARLGAETERQTQPLPPSDQQGEPAPPSPRKPAMAARWRRGQLRGALAGAVTASFLFLLAMMWASFHAVAPLPGDLNQGSIEQQVPFGAATVHGPPGVTVGGISSAKPVLSKSASVASGASPLSAAAPSSPPRVAPPAKPSPEWHHFRNNSRAEEGGSATNDVVVRHFSSNRNTTQTAQQRNEIIRYSDE